MKNRKIDLVANSQYLCSTYTTLTIKEAIKRFVGNLAQYPQSQRAFEKQAGCKLSETNIRGFIDHSRRF